MFDVTGAGDTVIATLAVMLAAGAGLEAAVRIANRAAGIVVGKLGTASPRRRDELFGQGGLMYYVVTGAAGFIGSNLVEALNARGVTEHHRGRRPPARRQVRRTSRACEIADYLDKARVPRGASTEFDGAVEAVLHQGACSDTMETDGRYMMENNYRYSKALLDWCQEAEVPFIYASSAAVYGASPEFREERACERRSTSTATRSSCSTRSCAVRCRTTTAQVAGFRYFNVYGPSEAHKGRMASVAFHPSTSSAARARCSSSRARRLRQRRAAARLRLRRRRGRRQPVVPRAPRVSGIFNCGTGRAQTFNELAAATINAVQGTRAHRARAGASRGMIEYIAFPAGLKEKYQSFTQADLDAPARRRLPGEFRTRGAGRRAPT